MNRIDTSDLPIPLEIVNNWQATLDLLAEVANVPSALIMRAHEEEIEIFCRNENATTPYKTGDKKALNSGLYCEKVMQSQQELMIPNAMQEPDWQHNPNIALGIISYCGLPVRWPDKAIFGTICIQDNKENHFSDTYRKLLALFRDSLESQLTTIYQQVKLQRLNQDLKLKVKSRTKDIASLNYSLSQEIDKRKAAEQEIDYQRNHDVTTGFLNYEALKRTLKRKLKSLDRNSVLTVVQIGFTNGRRLQSQYGDQALSELLLAYRERIGTIDCLSSHTCRISPVDLILVLEIDRTVAFIENFCHRLLELSHSEFLINQENLHLHAYIGAATSQQDSTAEELIQQARDAMLACKDAGYKYMLYSSQMSEQHLQVNQLECYLLQAVRNDDLMLYFQPQVDLKTGKWMGAEALIRWSHPNLGVISNESLIQMAEHNGLIFEVGNFVLRAAIEQASEWQNKIKEFKVAVNVSSVQLKNKHFIQQLEHLLQTYHLPAHYLEIELTESCLISNEILAFHTLQKLKQMGVTLSLDDFGTGCSSFSYLKKYPFSNIKIDKSFLQNIVSSEEDRDIMHSIIQVAKKMNLSVTVEGVETLEQEMLVVSEGCDYAQGYLYGKPMSSQEFGQVFLQQAESISSNVV